MRSVTSGNSRSKSPPRRHWDFDAERAILGAIFLSSEAADLVFDTLSRKGAEVFYDKRHKAIFLCLLNLHKAKVPIDITVVLHNMSEDGSLNEAGGVAYVSDLVGAVPTTTNVERYATIVLEEYERRLLDTSLERAKNQLDEGANVAQILKTLSRPDDGEKQTEEFESFPVNHLPSPLAEYVEAGASAIGCEPSMIALPLISGCAAAVGNSRILQLKSTWNEPCVIWTLVIGMSVSLKSPAHEWALQPLRELEMGLHQEFETALRKFEAAGQGKRPIRRQCVIADATVEAIAVRLRNNPRGLLLARDELSGWLGSFDQYKRRGDSDIAKYNEMQRAGILQVDRKGNDESVLVRRAAVSVTGGIQPGILLRAFTNQHYENGLAARFLMTYPPLQCRRWTENEVPESLSEQVGETIRALFSMPYE